MILVLIIFIVLIIPYLYYPKPKQLNSKQHYDYLLVLGYPPKQDGTCSNILLSRIKKAVELYHNNVANKLILSGGFSIEAFSEAQVMENYALKHGVKKEDIIIENKSRNTYQNLQFTKRIIQDNPSAKIIIITSPWHLRKTNKFASQLKFNYVMVKTEYPNHFSFLHILFAYLYSYMNMYKNMIYFLLKH